MTNNRSKLYLVLTSIDRHFDICEGFWAALKITALPGRVHICSPAEGNIITNSKLCLALYSHLSKIYSAFYYGHFNDMSERDKISYKTLLLQYGHFSVPLVSVLKIFCN